MRVRRFRRDQWSRVYMESGGLIPLGHPVVAAR